MIQQVACDIADIISLSGYITKHYDWCELIRHDDREYPAQYVGGGNYEQVMNFDQNGVSYLRKNGDASYSSALGNDNTRLVACGGSNFVQITLPLRLVAVVPKSKLSDNAFSDELLCQELIGLINGSSSVSDVGIRSLDYVVTGFSTDSLSIWSKEVKGMNYQMNFNYAFVSINFNVVGVINPTCLIQTCSS